jgi:hypothetical protein
MKKTQSLSILLILSILFLPLVACTGSSGTATQSTTGDLSLASQLALGTLKLDEASYPIDKDQAAELLPLWKALRALSSSDTTAPQEIEALVKQIQNTLTTDQINAITAMNLTNEDILAYMQAQGSMAGGAQGTPDSGAQATRQARIQSGVQRGATGGSQGGGPGGGGMPSGGFPGGDMGGGFPGGDIPMDGGMPGTVSGTPGAVPQNSSGVNIFLVNLVIQYLEAI